MVLALADPVPDSHNKRALIVLCEGWAQKEVVLHAQGLDALQQEPVNLELLLKYLRQLSVAVTQGMFSFPKK
jgi:hypothetical protein